MPYTYRQCRKFAILARQGKPVPGDWREHCRGVTKPNGKGKKEESKNESKR